MFPVEAFQKTLGKAIHLFERHEIRFHVTGGFTSVLYGEPRMTQDIDIVVDHELITKLQDSFIESLAFSDFLFEAADIRIAIEQRSMFQLFDKIEALKIDIYPRELVPGELDRSQKFELFEGMYVPVVCRMDAATSKLIWVSKGSHKSRIDLRNIYRTSTKAEKEQIQTTAIELKLGTLLSQVLEEPDEIVS